MRYQSGLESWRVSTSSLRGGCGWGALSSQSRHDVMLIRCSSVRARFRGSASPESPMVAYTGSEGLTGSPACMAAPISRLSTVFAPERVSCGLSAYCPKKYSSTTSFPWRAIAMACRRCAFIESLDASLKAWTISPILVRDMPTSSTLPTVQPSARARRRVRVRHAGPAARIEIADAVGRHAPEVVRAAPIVEEEGHDVAPHHTGQQFLARGVEYAYGAPGSLDAVGANEAAQVALGIAEEGGEPAVGPRGHPQIERELVVYRDDRTGEAVTTTRGEDDGSGEPAAARHRGGVNPLSRDRAAPRVQPAGEGAARQRERHAVARGTDDRAPSPRDSGAPFPLPAPPIDDELPAEVGAETLFRCPQPHKTRVAGGLRFGCGGERGDAHRHGAQRKDPLLRARRTSLDGRADAWSPMSGTREA